MEFTTILVTFLGVAERAVEGVNEEDFWRSVLATKTDLEATAAAKGKLRKLPRMSRKNIPNGLCMV